MRRKGELSKATMDRLWPHQVALPAPVVVMRFKEIQETARGLSACTRTHAFRRDDVDHVVYCFAALGQANAFHNEFGGELMGRLERPRWMSRR